MSRTFAKKSEYPLQWPAGISRCKSPQESRFNTTLFKALENVEKSLELLAKDSGKKVSDIRMTSNVTLNQRPDDGGIAVYFNWNDTDFCIPVDRYKSPADNLQAIHHIIEADRVKLRHGGIEFVMAEKRGQTLLLDDGNKAWWDVLGLDPKSSGQEIKTRYNELVKKHHHDVGGNSETFISIQKAYKDALGDRK